MFSCADPARLRWLNFHTRSSQCVCRYPSIHVHTLNLSQDHCRLLAHISKHSLSHLKPLSRLLSVVCAHIQAFTFTSETSLKTIVVCLRTCPSIHFHIPNLSEDHCRLLAQISKHSLSHLKPLSRPLSVVGTYPNIHFHISNLSQDHCRLLAHTSKH